MPDYQRILSYLYRYENENKKDCKGFIKAEQRGGTLKLTIQISDDQCPRDVKMDLLFYSKGEEGWKITRADSLLLAEGQEDLILQYDRESLPEAFQIQDQYGMAISCHGILCYGTVWIGEEIPAAWLAKTLKEPEADPAQESGEEKTVPVADGESGEEKAVSEAEIKPEEEKSADEVMVREADPAPAAEVMAREADPAPVDEVRLRAEESVSETMGQADLKSPELWATEEEAEGQKPPVPDLLEPVRDQSARADNIMNSALYEGYQITISQLRQLGEEADRLSDNQFLLSRYEINRHLLAGKVLYDGRARYCIGLPGIYDNRERYMAGLYQFPLFLGLSENRVKTGRPGYWLHLLGEGDK